MQKISAKNIFRKDVSFVLSECVSNRKEIWQDLLISADADFVSFMFLSYCGISSNTSFWMSIHSLEKYIKAYLLKNVENYDPKSDGHKLNESWGKLLKISKENNDCIPYDHPEYYSKFKA
ncbi:MAG: hypothetical protein D3922_04120 [Candidatus Electrothrix sp. AR1]|nr:hypothetical protein [Candidatus Electrothrix sp. AR1]